MNFKSKSCKFYSNSYCFVHINLNFSEEIAMAQCNIYTKELLSFHYKNIFIREFVTNGRNFN